MPELPSPRYSGIRADLITFPGINALCVYAEHQHRFGGRGSCPIYGVVGDGSTEEIGRLSLTSEGVEIQDIDPAEDSANA